MPNHKAFRAMGCDMLAVVDADDGAEEMLEQVPGWFEHWEQVLSRFRIDSELSMLNRQHGHPVHVSEILWEVFQAARWAEHYTHGLVTPTIAEALNQTGYDRSFELLTGAEFGSPASGGSYIPPLSGIVADAAERTLCLPEGLQLDFGGVAKGWAAHQAMLRLEALGPALVDAGGDIAISDSLPGPEPWEVAVADPLHAGEEITRLYLEDCGVATSGKDRRYWSLGGQFRHHIIDPRTGESSETDLMSATVIAPTVMQAEAASKTMMILGSREGIAWLRSCPGLAGLFVLEDGQVLATEQMQAYL
jgi:thiamine biosynthesis lipoprotein